MKIDNSWKLDLPNEYLTRTDNRDYESLIQNQVDYTFNLIYRTSEFPPAAHQNKWLLPEHAHETLP